MAASLEQLAVEVAALASRFAEVPDAGELSGRLEAVAEKAEVAQTGVAGLSGRVDELAASVPTEEVIEELRRQLSDLAARAGADGGAELGAAVASLAARLDEFAARVDEIAVPVAGLCSAGLMVLSARVEEVAAAIPVVETDGLVARIELLEEGSRSGGGTLEQLAVETDELRSQLQELTITSARAESVALLEAHVSELEHRVAATAELHDEIRRVGASASAGRDSLAHALFARVEEITATVPAADEVIELRLRVDELASRPMEDHVLQARVGELAARVESLALVEATVADLTASVAGLDGRIDRGVRDGHDRVDGLAEELSMRIGGLAKELSRRIDSLVARADGLVSRDQAEATAAEQAAWIRDELEVLREWTNVRAAAVDVALAEADDARVTGQQELGNRIDEAAGALRADAEAQARELERPARGKRERDGGAARARRRTRRNQRPTASAGRRVSRACSSSVSTSWQRASPTRSLERGPTRSTLSTRYAGRRTRSEGGSTNCTACTMLTCRTCAAQRSGLWGGSTRSPAFVPATQRRPGWRKRSCPRALDDHAMRSAAAAFEVEQRLQDEIGRLAAQLEERDASGIEARDELRVELERVASSMGWRLERIEESLAADDGAELECNGGGARTPPRRAGGDRVRSRRVRRSGRFARALPRSASGSSTRSLRTLMRARRCDARSSGWELRSWRPMRAWRIRSRCRRRKGVSRLRRPRPATGWSSSPAAPPEIGSTLELDVCDGPLVVTRYGSSPLPLDSRSCAYLERA